MAQKVHIVLIDDIDQTEADETVSFALDGREYTIDLSSDNAQKLRDVLAPYVAHGEQVSATRRRRNTASSSSGPSAAQIRVWARENGFEVSDRGRVPAEVRQAYDAAQGAAR